LIAAIEDAKDQIVMRVFARGRILCGMWFKFRFKPFAANAAGYSYSRSVGIEPDIVTNGNSYSIRSLDGTNGEQQNEH
jgi:hypothetical protein